MPKVTIYTQAYNPGKYLVQCIESVLGQTYTDFEWLLVDHGSTDDTPAIIDRYAEQDKRIVPIHIAVNGSNPNLSNDTVRQNGTGKYLTWLDSDDWWDPDYLEHLVPFAEENDLDLALTGAVEYFQEEGRSSVMRRWDRPLLMTADGFARNFPVIGPFAGAMWANLRSLEKVLELDGNSEDYEVWRRGLIWRSDTMNMLNYVDHCEKIGINEFAPYHYRKYGASLSRQYKDTYFEANLYFCQRLEEFFRHHGVLDEKMEEYIKRRFFFEMNWSLEVLRGTDMPAEEKVLVCAGMAAHPRTVQSLSCRCQEQRDWRGRLLDMAADALGSARADPLRAVLRPLAPDCWDAVTDNGLALFARERDLLAMLFQNDRQALAKRFLELIEKEEHPERYDLGVMLRGVLPEHSPLRQVEDVSFFRNYPELTRLISGSGYLAALDQMTALLLEEAPLNSGEAFLRLYLTLAALENQVPAFLFGKFHLAQLCQKENRLKECRAIVTELDEMGAEFPGLDALRAACGREGLL